MKHESRDVEESYKGTHAKYDKGGNQIQQVTEYFYQELRKENVRRKKGHKQELEGSQKRLWGVDKKVE